MKRLASSTFQKDCIVQRNSLFSRQAATFLGKLPLDNCSTHTTVAAYALAIEIRTTKSPMSMHAIDWASELLTASCGIFSKGIFDAV
jgi:hypothetical protein